MERIMKRVNLYILLSLSFTIAMSSEKRELNVGMLRPLEPLHPYYYNSIEFASVINLLYESVYRETADGIQPSFAALSKSSALSVLDRELEIRSTGLKWYPKKGRTDRRMSSKDVAFSYFYLLQNKAANIPRPEQIIRGFMPDPNQPLLFNVLLHVPVRERTLMEQLTFPIIAAKYGEDHIMVYDKQKQRFHESSNHKDALVLLRETQDFLSVRDILQSYDGKAYYLTERGELQCTLNRTFLTQHKQPVLHSITPGIVSFTFFAYKHLFPEIHHDFGIEEIRVSLGNAFQMLLKSGTKPDGQRIGKFLDRPILFRRRIPGMTETNNYWTVPQTSYKFSVGDNQTGVLTLDRKQSRVKGVNSSRLSVQNIRFAKQAGNDDTTIRRHFAAGSLDMLMRVPHSLAEQIQDDWITRVPTKGRHIEMIAMNCAKQKDNPLADVRVRRAINHALNKRNLKYFMPKGGLTLKGPLSSADDRTGLSPSKLKYDLSKAKRLMKSAGYTWTDPHWTTRSGKPLTLKLIFESKYDSRDLQFLLGIKDQLRRFGIKIEEPLEGVARADFFKQLRVLKTWHLALVRRFHDSTTDLSIYNPDSPKNFFNFKPSKVNAAQLMRLYDDYAIAQGSNRRNLKKKIAELIRQEAPAIFLWDFRAHFMVNDKTVRLNTSLNPSTFNVLEFIDSIKLLQPKDEPKVQVSEQDEEY